MIRIQTIAPCVAALGLALAACQPPPRRPAPAPATVDPELVRTLAVLATGEAPTAAQVDATSRRIDAGQLTVAAYIDQLLASDRFASDVAPLVILRELLSQDDTGVPTQFGLEHTDGPHPVYYLDKPCAWDQAVEVQPWWELVEGRTDTIRVCPDSYQPDKWTADVPPGEPETECASDQADGKRYGCGCGPQLMRCFDSDDRASAFVQSLRAELRDTIAHAVVHDTPLEQIFTANATFRDRNVEIMMRVFAAEAARHGLSDATLRELAAWPAAGKWAPREDLAPGENAGILTSPQLVHYQVDRRQRMTTIYDILWCDDPDSVGATPEGVLSIAGNDLQIKSAGWRDLAARPICTNCHARLDYGMQFFWGFDNDNLRAYFVPSLQQTGRGPLYGRAIDDPRGEAELNPHGFAELATAQPEFRHCMARDFAGYVLGNRVRPDEVARVEAAMHPNATSARDLMRTALLELVDAWPERRAALAEAAPAPAASAATQLVTVTPALHAQLDTCLDCHDKQPDRPDLSRAQLDRRTVAGMLEDVAFGLMPKDHPFAEPARRQFLEAFIAATWSGADATAAHAYYVDRSAALPAYRPEIAFGLIHRLAHSKGPSPLDLRMMENAVRPDLQQMSPGYIMLTGLGAVAACRETAKTRAERDRCISDAVKLENLSHR